MGHLNPNWNETCSDDEIAARFQKAMALVGAEFIDRVRFYSEVWWPARQLVKKALEQRHEVSKGGTITRNSHKTWEYDIDKTDSCGWRRIIL